MSPSSMSDPAPETSGVSTRRWRRVRARMRIMRLRMRSHPVLLWTWRIAVVIAGGTLMLIGFILWFTPGPGWAAVILGLAVLATEFGWARALLRKGREQVLSLRDRVLRRPRPETE